MNDADDMSMEEFVNEHRDELEEMVNGLALYFKGKKTRSILLSLSYFSGHIISISPDHEMMKQLFLRFLDRAIHVNNENS